MHKTTLHSPASFQANGPARVVRSDIGVDRFHMPQVQRHAECGQVVAVVAADGLRQRQAFGFLPVGVCGVLAHRVVCISGVESGALPCGNRLSAAAVFSPAPSAKAGAALSTDCQAPDSLSASASSA
jgi:hypothetical protein